MAHKNAGSGRRGRRRIMRALKINEISAVDRPAQQGATAVIMKRRGEPGYDPDNPDPRKRGRDDTPEKEAELLAKRGGDLVDTLTGEQDGHQHGISLMRMDDEGRLGIIVSFASDPESDSSHDHQVVQMSDGSYVMGVNDGHTHEIDQNAMRQAIFDFMTKSAGEFQAEKRTFTARQRERLAESGAAMPNGSFPIVDRSDLSNAADAFGRAGDTPAVARHIKRRAEALGATNLLPGEGRLADLLKSDNKEVRKEDTMTDEEKKTLEDAQKRAADAEGELKVTKALAEMTDPQKAHLATLDPALDDEARKAFIAATPAERDAAVKKATEADPVVYTADDGSVYRKSDDARLVSQAKRADELAKQNAELAKAASDADLRKRAEELGHIPGTADSKVEMLKAIDAIKDEDARKASLEALKAQNESMSKAFETYGVNTGVVEPVQGSPDAELDTMTKKYHEANPKLTEAQAYDAVLKTDAGRALYAKSVN